MALQEAGQLAKSIIDAGYKGYVSHSVLAQFLVIPNVKLVCILLPFAIFNVRHSHLGIYI